MKNEKLEKALRAKIRRVILEIQLEKEFVRGLRILESDVVKELSSKPKINEGISTAVGLLLSGPYIVKLFGKFVSFIDGVVKKFNGKGFGGQQLADKIIEFSEKYHEKVMWIFKKVAGMFTKDEHKKEQIASLLFTGVVAALLAHSVGDILTKVQSTLFDTEILTTGMKAAVKAGEVYDGIKKALGAIMPKVVSIAQH